MVEAAHGCRRNERLLITDPCCSVVPHWPHGAGQYGWCRLGKSSFLLPCQESGGGVSCSLDFAFDLMRMYWSAWLYSWANCLVIWPVEHMSPWKDCFPLIVAFFFFLCLVQSSQQLRYFHAHVGRFLSLRYVIRGGDRPLGQIATINMAPVGLEVLPFNSVAFLIHFLSRFFLSLLDWIFFFSPPLSVIWTYM